jgi:hypothetical protein
MVLQSLQSFFGGFRVYDSCLVVFVCSNCLKNLSVISWLMLTDHVIPMPLSRKSNRDFELCLTTT